MVFLSFTHLLGLAPGIGTDTVKFTQLTRCNSDYEFLHVSIMVGKSITRLIAFGPILLTLSALGWVLQWTAFTILFIVKLALVIQLWMLGLFIDNVIEPRFEKLTPVIGEQFTKEFIRT
jgi:ABC-type polysaccharide/polyol phosphate export permease